MNNPFLLMIPGLSCDAALWRYQLDGLGDMAEMAVADVAGPDSIAAMAGAVLAAAPARFALAALSMGGYVAQEIMRRAPERVTRLALLDTSARADTASQAAYRRDMIALAGRGEFKGVTRRLLPMLIHEDRLEDAALTTVITEMTQRVGLETYVRQQTAIMNRRDGRKGLAAIRCPSLVLCGREDRLTPLDHHEEMAASIPGARLVVIENCGHLAPLERPHEVNRALREWLS